MQNQIRNLRDRRKHLGFNSSNHRAVPPQHETELFSIRHAIFSRLTVLISSQNLGPCWHDTIKLALNNGITMFQIEECILHLGIYVGFPKSLQCFMELKNLGFSTSLSHLAMNSELKLASEGVPKQVPDQFNFFLQPDIQVALHNIHPDFGWLAGTTASALCARGGLTPLERAHITLMSDICQNVFKGPFQIHVRMVLQCAGTEKFMQSAIAHLIDLTHEHEDFAIPVKNLFKADELLPFAISEHRSFLS